MSSKIKKTRRYQFLSKKAKGAAFKKTFTPTIFAIAAFMAGIPSAGIGQTNEGSQNTGPSTSAGPSAGASAPTGGNDASGQNSGTGTPSTSSGGVSASNGGSTISGQNTGTTPYTIPSGGVSVSPGGSIVNNPNLSTSSSPVSGGGASISTGNSSKGTNGSALLLNSGSMVNGSVSNSGNIIGSTAGIQISSQSKLLGGIVNSSLQNQSLESTKSSLTNQMVSSTSNQKSVGATSVTWVLDSARIVSGIVLTATGAGDGVGAALIVGGLMGIEMTDGSLSGRIVNGGLIYGAGTEGSKIGGIYVSPDSSVQGGITNLSSGIIAGNKYSLNLGNANNAFEVNNYGLLFGDVNLGINRLNLNGVTSQVIGDTIGTSASIVNVNGLFSSQGGFNVGAFNIAPTGIFVMNNNVTLTGAPRQLINQGNLIIPASQHPVINGDYLQSGKLTEGILNPLSYGQLTITNGASFTSSSTFSVQAGSLLSPNTTYKSVISANFITGFTNQYGIYQQGISAYSYAFNLNGSSIDLTVGNRSLTSTYAAELKKNNNVAAMGAANELFSFALNSTAAPGMNPVADLLNAKSGLALSNAVSQTLPLLAGAGSLATASSQRIFNQFVSARQNSLAGTANGEEILGNREVWGKAYGAWGNQQTFGNVPGYSSSSGGFLLGADYVLSAQKNLGLAVGISNGSISANNSAAPSNLNITSYQIGGYGNHLIEKNLNWNYQVNGAFNQNNGSRNISFYGANANSSYNSYTGHIGTGLQQFFDITDQLRMAPFIRADYLTVQSRAYSESNAGALDLNVSKQTSNELYTSTGVKWDYEFIPKIKLSVNLGAAYNPLNRQVLLTSSYAGGGNSFTTYGLQVSPWLYSGGLGVSGMLQKNIELNIRYDAQATISGYLNQTASAKLKFYL
jgi:outer membrane autotransporter protein